MQKMKKTHAIESIAHDVFDYVIESVLRDQIREFLFEQRIAEKLIYDDLMNRVFQVQFESILKQIAIELNNDMLLDKLAEAVYFSSLSTVDHYYDDSLQGFNNTPSVVLNTHNNSIFMSDLHSFLHACVYEFTRLNLSVNRELYYELKQALNLNRLGVFSISIYFYIYIFNHNNNS